MQDNLATPAQASFLDQLADETRFVVAVLRPKAGGGTDKVPVDPYTGRDIDAQNPENWLTGAEAQLWAGTLGPSYGVGYVIHESAKRFCIDLDACREGNGWQPHVANFIARFPGCYVEVSQSGNGIHIFGTYEGDIPAHRVKNKIYHIECYSRARFIFLGSQGYGSVTQVATKELAAFIAQFFPPKEAAEHGTDWTTEPVAAWKGPADDDELLARMMRSSSANSTFADGARFADLWTGNVDRLAVAYPSANHPYDGSGADLALCNNLAYWTGNDCERMLRFLMRDDCGLRREKWARVDNYLTPTILEACGAQREWYKERKADRIAASTAPLASVTVDTSGNVVTPVAAIPTSVPAVTTAAPASLPAPPGPLSFLPATQAAHVLTLSSKNKHEATLPNIIEVLKRGGHAALGFDTFLGKIMIASPGGQNWQPLKDSDMVRLREALERQNFEAISAALIRDSLQVVAELNSYDSVVTWLNNQVWDGVPRIDNFLHVYCGATDDEYTRAVSRYIWTGLPARVFEPGCQLDMIVAFQSRQGTRKSSGFQALAPSPEYFTDGLDLSRDDDNFKRMMQGKIIVEIAEGAGLRKTEVEYVKRIITRKVEEWVEKWKTIPTRYPRRNMLFMSTNNLQFLPQDETGQRRWLPVEIVMLDDVLITRDCAQLWAEGAARWHARKNAGEHGVDWRDAERLAASRHAKYEQSDPWDKRIAEWLDAELEIPGQVLRPAPSTRPLHISEILEGAIQLDAARIDRKAENRAAGVMRALGYKKKNVRIAGIKNPVERWIAPETDAE